MEEIGRPKERKRKEIIFQIEGMKIIITTSKISNPEITIMRSEIKKSVSGKEELLSRGEFFINLPVLRKIKDNIGEKALENLIKLAYEQIKPNIFSDTMELVIKIEKKREAVEEKIKEKKETSTKKKEVFSLSEIFSNIESLIENALNSQILTKKSKQNIENLKSKLKEKINIEQKDKEALDSMIEILKNFLVLSNIGEISKNPDSVLVLIKNKYITADYLLNILNKIKEGKSGEALSMLITVISNSFRNKKLEINREVFLSYISPLIAITADKITRNLNFSRESLDRLSYFLKQWKEKK